MIWRTDEPEMMQKGLCVDKDGNMAVGIFTKYGWIFPLYFGTPVAWCELPQYPPEDFLEREK